MNLFPYSPSWGEINYFAFQLVSEEFHNELFGLLHDRAKETKQKFADGQHTVGKSIPSMDKWLNEQPGCPKTDDEHWNEHDNYRSQTMPAYIRNYIDHPGDSEIPGRIRKKPERAEIKTSIEFMLSVLNRITKK